MFYFINKQNKTVFFQNVNVLKDKECSRSMETRLVMTQYGACFGTGTGSRPEGAWLWKGVTVPAAVLAADGGCVCGSGPCLPVLHGARASSHGPQLWLPRVGRFLLVFPRQVGSCLSADSPSARTSFLDSDSGHPGTSSVCGLNLLIFTLKI